jgi:hypothetical protein
MPLAEFQRARLDSIVQGMLDEGMSDSTIQAVVDSFKSTQPEATKTVLGGIGSRQLGMKEPMLGEQIGRFALEHGPTMAAVGASLLAPQMAGAPLWARLLGGVSQAARAGAAAKGITRVVGEQTGVMPKSSFKEKVLGMAGEGTVQGLTQGGGNVASELLGLAGKGAARMAFKLSLTREEGRQLGKVWDTLLKERLRVGSYAGTPGSQRAWDLIGKQGKVVDRIVSKMQAAGHRITPDQVAAKAIQEQNDQLFKQGALPLTPQETSGLVQSIHDTFTDALAVINRGVQRTTQVGATPVITPVEAQEVKQDISKRLRPEFRAQKEMLPKPERIASRFEQDVYGGLKESLEGLPTPVGEPNIKDVNARTSKLIDLAHALMGAEGYKAPFLSRYGLPYMGAAAAGAGYGMLGGGTPQERLTRGAETAIAFHLLTDPRSLSRIGLTLTDPLMKKLFYQQAPRLLMEASRNAELQPR